MIQGGDPTGTGRRRPRLQDGRPAAADGAYTQGVVAMAKTGAEPPGTSGSQFFVVTGADAGLPPDYAIVGKVTEGSTWSTRSRRSATETEQPTQPVVIERVTVESES